MKFAKANWERKNPAVQLSPDVLSQLIEPMFPNRKVESFDVLSPGLANTNVRFTISGLEEYFVLRLYTQNRNALSQELSLAKQFNNFIPMPEFLYVDKSLLGHVYAIQRWIKGEPLHTLLDKITLSQAQIVAKEVAKALSNIARQSFSKGGFFKDNLEIVAFEGNEAQHPFISYIQDCLFEHYAGKWLGEALAERVWKFVLNNQAYFPSLEPACLVHGDFNLDNILIDENTFTVAGILDWEFAFAGSYLFDIGTLLRFEVPEAFETKFLEVYKAETGITFPEMWRKMIKLQDLSNLIGLLNIPRRCPNRIHDIKMLIQEILTAYSFN